MNKYTIPLLLLIAALAVVTASAAPSATNNTIIGIEWNASSSSTTLRWIDENGTTYTPDANFFNNHRIWGNMWRCTINTTTNDLTFGSNARGDGLVLNGSTGEQVMVILPKFYTKSEYSTADGYTKYRYWISPDPHDGYTVHPLFNQRGGTTRNYVLIGAYAGSFGVNSTTNTKYLNSVTGRQPWTGGSGVSDGIFYLGFDTGTGSAPTIGQTITGSTSTQQGIVEGVYTSSGTWGSNATGIIYLSRPVTVNRSAVFTNTENLTVGGTVFAKVKTATANSNFAATMTTLQDYADNYGDGWGIQNIYDWSAIQLLFYVEYGNLNSQSVLAKGITDKAGGTGFAGEVTGYNSADTNVATTGTGSGTGTNGLTPVVWRGIENPWSNIWYYVIGFNSLDASYRIAKRDGTGILAEQLTSGNYETSTCIPLTGNGIPSDPMQYYRDGYITTIESEDLLINLFVPKSLTGGGSTTYFADYGYSHSSGGTRVLLAGGYWTYSASAGVAARYSPYGVGYSYRHFGARPERIGGERYTGMSYANVSVNTTAPSCGGAVVFTDTTTGVAAIAWNWSFGDGTYSTLQNPSHTYTVAGNKTVVLTITNVYGGTDTVTKTDYINVIPSAAFSGTPMSGSVPLTVAFTDSSCGGGGIVSWNWSFGDGVYSSLQNPVHTYTTSGNYTVTLLVTSTSGSSDNETKNNYISATTASPYAPISNFIGSPTSGTAPLNVTFTDMSTNGPTSWNWSFGDGNYSSSQNPTHVYAYAGTFTVSLTSTNSYGSNTMTRVGYITVGATPTPTPTIPIPTPIGGGMGIFNITEKHGETWIQWFWRVPTSEIGSNNTLWVFVDDVMVLNMSLRSNMSITDTYLLSGLSGNEQHKLTIKEVFLS